MRYSPFRADRILYLNKSLWVGNVEQKGAELGQPALNAHKDSSSTTSVHHVKASRIQDADAAPLQSLQAPWGLVVSTQKFAFTKRRSSIS